MAHLYPPPSNPSAPYRSFQTLNGTQNPASSPGNYYGGGNDYSFQPTLLSPVTGNSETVTLQATAYWTSSGGTSNSGTDTESITAVIPRVTAISFLPQNGNEVTLTDYPGGGDINDPVWTKPLTASLPTKNEPAAYIRSTNARVKITLEAQANLTAPVDIQVRGQQVGPNDENFYPVDLRVQNWPADVTLDSSPLYTYMNHYSDLEVKWQYRVVGWGTWYDMTQSSHRVYIVHDSPRITKPLDQALQYATSFAANQTGIGSIASQMALGVRNNVTYAIPGDSSGHLLGHLQGTPGQCTRHVGLFELLIESCSSYDVTSKDVWGGSPQTLVGHLAPMNGSLGTLRFSAPLEDTIGVNPVFAYHRFAICNGSYYDPTYGTTGVANVISLAAQGVNYYTYPGLNLLSNNSPVCSVMTGFYMGEGRYHTASVTGNWPVP